MALRLIELVVPERDVEKINHLIIKYEILEYQPLPLPNAHVLVRILLDTAQNEALLDLLEKHYSGMKSNRIIMLPVAATLPPILEKPVEQIVQQSPQRISRAELYENIKQLARCSFIYLTMVVLSTIVAAVGLLSNNDAIIIGAMVIAPMLGPSVALALATTLGDLRLLKQAVLTELAGVIIVIILSSCIGAIVSINPALPEIASRTHVGPGVIAVAIASGGAGALSFTTGVSEALIGVMVSVALLPPLVTFGLLLGAGYDSLSLGALYLFLINLVCVNMTGVATFLAQGIGPLAWWEKQRAKRATFIAFSLWVVIFSLLMILIVLFNHTWSFPVLTWLYQSL